MLTIFIKSCSYYFIFFFTLQYCIGFAIHQHVSAMGVHVVPILTPPPLPPHTIPLGHPSAPASSILHPALNLDWWFISYMILYRFQCQTGQSNIIKIIWFLPLVSGWKSYYLNYIALTSFHWKKTKVKSYLGRPKIRCGSDDKESACNAGDPGSIPELGRFSGEGNDNPLQYSCLENSKTEKSGGLHSMGLHRVRHKWATSGQDVHNNLGNTVLLCW